MAIGVNEGSFETVIRVRDEGSQALKEFAANAQQSLKDTSSEAERSSEAVSKGGLSIAGMGKLVAGGAAAAVTAIGWATKAAIDNADKMQRMAQQIGISTEALSALKYTASLADVPFEKLAGNLTIMQRNLANVAETGKGPAAKVLEKLGLDADALVKAKPEQAIAQIADALELLPTQAEKLAAAQSIFGKGGKEMVLVLEGGSKALRESAEEAKRFGAIIGGETGENADAFNDNITRIQTQLSGFGNLIAADVVKPLGQILGQVISILEQTRLIDGAALVLGATFKAIAIPVGLLATAIEAIVKAVRGVANALREAFSGDGKKAIDTLKATIDSIVQSFQKFGDFFRGILGFKKSSFTGAGGEFIKGAFGGTGQGAGVYSDVLPGAETYSGLEAEGESERQALDARASAEQEHLDRSQERWLAYHQTRAQYQQTFDRISFESASFFFGQLAALMQTKSKAMFQIGKAAAIAQTIIDTYAAAQASYKALAGIPIVGPALGAAAAAAAIVAGLARVQAIRSTQYGAQTASPVYAANPSTGLPATSSAGQLPAAPAVAAQSAREVNIFLRGSDVYSAQSVRDSLIPAINEALGDGVQLNVRALA